MKRREILLTSFIFFAILIIERYRNDENRNLKNSVQVLFGSDTPTINGEEYLALLDGAKSQAEKEFYTQVYNYLLAKDKKK